MEHESKSTPQSTLLPTPVSPKEFENVTQPEDFADIENMSKEMMIVEKNILKDRIMQSKQALSEKSKSENVF
jgi:hypothetical protein